MSTEVQTAAELARMRAELHALTKTIERVVDDHESRVRVLEATSIKNAATFKTLYALATLPTTGLVLFLIRQYTSGG